jgi:diaminohydroxyphosphoribosylaminopyrimidine deaminase/5-amino-6-(5-phosphoribosylamino)uracil reductase
MPGAGTEQLMREAMGEALSARGTTHPNPAVGALVVEGDSIIARGATQPAGGDHAEIVALKALKASGHSVSPATTLIVTLEPCSTTGRTGPCTEAIIESGIRRVVVGAIDPNPHHQGRGLDRLRDAGVAVEAGVLESDCEDLNLIFNWVTRMEKPFLAGKIATTLDGRMATRGGLSKWITGEEARANVHQWRNYFPAIAVGSGTVLADDPELTIRRGDEVLNCPVRFVFDRNLVTVRDTLPKLYRDEWKERTIIVTSAGRKAAVERLKSEHGLNFWELADSESDGGFGEFSERCLSAGLHGVFVEGGPHLLSSFIEFRYLHYLFAYRAPKLLADTSGLAPFMGQSPASMDKTLRLTDVRHDVFEEDQLMRGFLSYAYLEDT